MSNAIETLLICKRRHPQFNQVPRDIMRMIIGYVLGDLNIDIVISWIISQPKIQGLTLGEVFSRHVLIGMPIGYWPLIRDYAQHLDRLFPRNYHYKRDHNRIYDQINLTVAKWFIPHKRNMLEKLKSSILSYSYKINISRGDNDPRSTDPVTLNELLRLMILETSRPVIIREFNENVIEVMTDTNRDQEGNKIVRRGKQSDIALLFQKDFENNRMDHCIECLGLPAGILARCPSHT